MKENVFNFVCFQNTNWRARDDLDMDLALRPRMNAPDVVRSALGHGEKISENTIDNLLLAPNKIVIPERYIPETVSTQSKDGEKSLICIFFVRLPNCRPRRRNVVKRRLNRLRKCWLKHHSAVQMQVLKFLKN